MKRVDFHVHVLPGADHGSENLEISVQQLQWAKKFGVDTIVATPHFYGWKQKIENLLEVRQKTSELLAPYAEKIGITIVPAAEVTLFQGLADQKLLEDLTVPSTSYLLLEMPTENWGNWVYTEIEKIISIRGIQPIIVHVDRYPEKEVAKLLEWDLVYQINAEAFQSFWSRRKYVQWVKQRRVHLLGSDTHGGDGKDFQDFDKALLHLGSSGETLMQNARKILADKRI